MTPTRYDLKRRIGVVPQQVAVINELTVHENIADRRGSRRRFDAVRESAPRSSSHDTPRT